MMSEAEAARRTTTRIATPRRIRWVGMAEVRNRYGDVSADTIKRWVAEGVLPSPVPMGTIVLWSEADLDEADERARAQARAKLAARKQARAKVAEHARAKYREQREAQERATQAAEEAAQQAAQEAAAKAVDKPSPSSRRKRSAD